MAAVKSVSMTFDLLLSRWGAHMKLIVCPVRKGVEKEACKLVPKKTKVFQKDCQSYQEVEMPYCEGLCNTFTK